MSRFDKSSIPFGIQIDRCEISLVDGNIQFLIYISLSSRILTKAKATSTGVEVVLDPDCECDMLTSDSVDNKTASCEFDEVPDPDCEMMKFCSGAKRLLPLLNSLNFSWS